ncbi:MAG: lysophospholipase [Marinicaulis sp.]|nr:lysophospholipase [Marinicaulis sp.]
MITLRFFMIAVTVAYFAAGLALYLFQDRFLYFPTPEVERDDAEALFLDRDGIRIKVWKVTSGNDKAIIYFGGNAENVANSIPNFKHALAGYDLYLMNYRGFGGSGGKPREKDLYGDAQAVYELVDQDYDNISVIGRSLGSGVATYIAANEEIEKLALITPYDSIQRIAQKKFPVFPVALFLKDKYDSVSRAPQISAQTLIMIAENDGVITRDHTERLVSAVTMIDPKVITVKDASHLSLSNTPEFWSAVDGFFRMPAN